MKYIDAGKLIAEIERQKRENLGSPECVCDDILSFITSLQQEQPAIPFMAGLKGILPAGTKTIWRESKATPEKLVLKNDLTGEVVVERTIPEHMRGADPEIAYACATLLSAGWTLIAPGFEEVDLEKELDTWRHEHFHGKRDEHFSGEYLERSSQLALDSYFFNLGLNSKK